MLTIRSILKTAALVVAAAIPASAAVSAPAFASPALTFPHPPPATPTLTGLATHLEGEVTVTGAGFTPSGTVELYEWQRSSSGAWTGAVVGDVTATATVRYILWTGGYLPSNFFFCGVTTGTNDVAVEAYDFGKAQWSNLLYGTCDPTIP